MLTDEQKKEIADYMQEQFGMKLQVWGRVGDVDAMSGFIKVPVYVGQFVSEHNAMLAQVVGKGVQVFRFEDCSFHSLKISDSGWCSWQR